MRPRAKQGDAPDWVYERFDQLNRQLFRGRLPDAPIGRTTAFPHWNGWYAPFPDGRGCIFLHEDTLEKRTERYIADSLLHEMVHHALHTTLEGDDKEHSTTFVREANRAGRLLGLPSVRPRTKDAECWPQSVRKDSYWG
jgi:hypothetical protein